MIYFADYTRKRRGLAPGLTVPEASLSKHNYRVVCSILVENYSKWRMTSPVYFTETGVIENRPVPVMPGDYTMIILCFVILYMILHYVSVESLHGRGVHKVK